MCARKSTIRDRGLNLNDVRRPEKRDAGGTKDITGLN